MNDNNAINWGNRVICTAKLLRVYRRGAKNPKTWTTHPQAPFQAIWLGHRRLSNGDVTYIDGQAHYTPGEYITAGLVSPGPRANPIYVPTDHIQKATPELKRFVTNERYLNIHSARQIAGRIWTDPQLQHTEIDTNLTEQIAQLLHRHIKPADH